MSVTKTTGADVYSVRNAGEWATIVVREWSDAREDGREQHRGEILINSTFGSWSQYWGAPGVRFRKFLVGLDFGYLFGRFMGLSLDQYDGDATLAKLQRELLDLRRRRSICREAARYTWNEIDSQAGRMQESVEGWVDGCHAVQSECESSWAKRSIPSHELDDISGLFEEPWLATETRDHPQAVGFWRDIWPEFVTALRAELEPAPEAACAN